LKREQLQAALDEAFCDVLKSEYHGALITALAQTSPNFDAVAKQFSTAFDINLKAHALASRAIAAHPDVKDEP
jgi:hypothetical protein